VKNLYPFFFSCLFGVALFIPKKSFNTIYTINVTLSGAQEVPPVPSPATGTLTGTYDDATNTLSFTINFSGLVSATNNAHFHAPALPGVNAPVVIGFIPGGFPLGVLFGTYSNSYTLTAMQELELLGGLWYVNIHTNGFPGGEIRGQLTTIPCNYSWAAQTSGTTSQLLTVSAVSGQIAWAAGVGPTVRRTLDGGATWTSATGIGINGGVFNIYAVDGNTAFCTTTPGATFIYKTINGGTTWTQVFTQAGGFIDAIQMISPTEGYAVGDPVGGTWTILKTIDVGDTWARMATEPAQVGTEGGWNNSFLIIGTDIWFGTGNTRVYHSPDLGATWSFAATTGTLNTFAVHFNSTGASGLGLAGGSAMVKSIDGGTSYAATGAPGTTGNIDGLEGNGTDWWALRSDANIYKSTDQGATAWTIDHTQAGAVFQDIDFVIAVRV